MLSPREPRSIWLAATPGGLSFFAEDDCRFYPRVTAATLAAVAAAAGPRIGWLGYRARAGQPVYGAHLLSFTEAALAALEEHAPRHLRSRILALDTLLHRLWREGYVCIYIYIPPAPLAFQEVHSARGRR